MRSHRFFAGVVGLSLLLLTVRPAADAGKGTKKPPKSATTDAEPWVAGYTLKQWVEFYRTGDAKQKQRAAEMIAWCCTERKSVDAAKAMIEVLDDERHRLAACKAIARMNWEGRVALPALLPWASAKEKSTETRIAALDALGSIGLTRPGVLDVLIEGLHDRDDGVRRTAGYAIYRIGADARPLVPALIAALKDPAPVVAEAAAIALSGIGPDAKEAGPALSAALRHPNFLVRRHVTEALQRLHSDDPAIHKALIAALKDENAEVSSGSVWALHFCRDVGDDVVDGLCWALQHGNESMRYYAANAMSEHGIASPQTIKPLVAALENKKTRAVAATALGKRRPVTETTLAALMAAFEKGHYERIAIANALAEMGPAAESTARRLKEALKERAAEARWSYELVHVACANALWKITKDRDMIPVLAKLATYPYDHHVTNGAALALGDIGPDAKAAVPDLIVALKAPREYWAAARALARIGAAEGEAALREMLASSDRDKRLLAAYSLWDLKRDPKALSEIGDNASTHPDRHARRHAVMTLGKMDPENELALLRIAAALEDDCPYVQKEAARALPRFGPEARLAVRALARLLGSDSWSVADQAARTLAALGPVAAKALPELRKAAENPLLHLSATEAIKKIER
jgi:HEAT repeat protein